MKDGNEPATKVRIVLVAEAWGSREAMFKHALVGPSGRELARMLSTAKLAPELRVQYPNELEMISHWTWLRDCYGICVTNVFDAHPHNDDIENFFLNVRDGGMNTLPPLRPGKYLMEDFFHHVQRLWDFLSQSKPNLIIALGNTASWAVLGKTGISDLRGCVQMSKRLNIKVLPTFHPASVLRNWPQRPTVIADLKKAKHEVEFPEVRRIERWITAHDSRNNIRITLDEIEKWLSQPADEYAIDIESGHALYSKAERGRMTPGMLRMINSQISMVGFARNPHEALVIPLMTRDSPDLCYWPDEVQETQAWKYILWGLKRPIPKTFQNGLYDMGRFLAHGLVPAMCRRDTMIHHHAIFPELPKALGFLGSVYTKEIAWKGMYDNRDSLKQGE